MCGIVGYVGPRDAAAALKVLQESFCAIVLDPQFVDVGIHRDDAIAARLLVSISHSVASLHRRPGNPGQIDTHCDPPEWQEMGAVKAFAPPGHEMPSGKDAPKFPIRTRTPPPKQQCIIYSGPGRSLPKEPPLRKRFIG